MALTNSDATDINTVLRYFLHIPDVMGVEPDDDRAKEAAVRLADRANKKLWAGITDKDVRQAWR